MGDVVQFNGVTRLDIDPDPVLESAVGKLEWVVIIGVDSDGYEYFASSKADGAEVNWALDRAKYKLQQITDDEG